MLNALHALHAVFEVAVTVRVSVMVRVSIRTSWVANFAPFRCYRPVIYTRPILALE